LLEDAGIIEQNDFALVRESVGHRRIPMVHGAVKCWFEDERHAARFAEAAIGKRMPLASTNCVGAVWWV